MKSFLFALAVTMTVTLSIGLSAHNNALSAQSPKAVMSQSKARAIMIRLDSWKLNSGERPTAGPLSRDCMGASAKMLYDGGINHSIFPVMGFWSSVIGAVVIREQRNGGNGEIGEDTRYRQQLENSRSEAEIPLFVRDYFAECEAIRKRFGG